MTTHTTSSSLPQNDSSQGSSPKALFNTYQAAHVILGGLDTQSYWGFDFDEFVSKFRHNLIRDIGNPVRAPWRGVIDFTTQDYIELRNVIDSLDFTRDPANLMDESIATEFARRSDILGLHGPIGSGKDTAADALGPRGFTRMSFADPLRVAGSMVYGIPLRYFIDRELKESPLPNSKMTPRRVLQIMGTEVCRSIEERLWVKRTMLRIASAMDARSEISMSHPNMISGAGGIKVVIPDVRFQNEADFVRFVGGRIVRLSRPYLDAQQLMKKGGGHASESGISSHPTDIELVNSGSIQEFKAATVNLLGDIDAALERRISARRNARPRP